MTDLNLNETDDREPRPGTAQLTCLSPARCRHCGRPTRFGRPRGLCWRCYEDLAVREMYEAGDRGGIRGPDGRYRHGLCADDMSGRGRDVPPGPTGALPGTIEKIDVMMRRLEAGYHLHHPDDAPMDPEGDALGLFFT